MNLNRNQSMRCVSAVLVMAALTAAASAAPARKPAAAPREAPAPAAEPAPPKKRSFFRRLTGRRENPPADKTPAAQPPAPAPKSLAEAGTLKPSGRQAAAPKRGAKPAPAPAVRVAERPAPAPAGRVAQPPAPSPAPAGSPAPEKKKRSLFSRLFRDPEETRPAPVPEEAKMPLPDDWSERLVVSDDQAGLYDYGPSQPGGPTVRLPLGTVVKVVQKERGWTRVELENGQTGYVGSDQLRAAELADFAQPERDASQLAALRSAGTSPKPWAPTPPPPDLPNLPINPDLEAALLLLPPLESPGSAAPAPLELKPGDVFPPEPAAADSVEPPGPTATPDESPTSPPAPDSGPEADKP